MFRGTWREGERLPMTNWNLCKTSTNIWHSFGPRLFFLLSHYVTRWKKILLKRNSTAEENWKFNIRENAFTQSLEATLNLFCQDATGMSNGKICFLFPHTKKLISLLSNRNFPPIVTRLESIVPWRKGENVEMNSSCVQKDSSSRMIDFNKRIKDQPSMLRGTIAVFSVK